MKQHGRQSAAASVVAAERWENRAPPPAELTEAQAALWRDILSTKSSDYFDAGTVPLLRDYVILNFDVLEVNSQMAAFETAWLATDDGLKRYSQLVSLRDKMHNRMVKIATSLRITNQARYHPTTAGNREKKPGAQKPWEGA